MNDPVPITLVDAGEPGDPGTGQDDQPAPMVAGTFALYDDHQGGLVLVTDVEGRGVERRHVPGGLLRMIGGSGPMARILGRLGGV